MKTREFIDKFTSILNDINSTRHKEHFIQNMMDLNKDMDMEFADWVLTFLAWSELTTKDDIRRYYGHMDMEDTETE